MSPRSRSRRPVALVLALALALSAAGCAGGGDSGDGGDGGEGAAAGRDTVDGVADGGGVAADCERATPEGWSVARAWNEAVLGAIRSDFPAPTVHARNLFHTSAAMWDAWAAYDPELDGVFVDEDATVDGGPDDVRAAREEAMSYAAYRILLQRYLPSPGAEQAVTSIDELMANLCLDITETAGAGPTPAALGNRIAAEILAAGLTDGSNESGGYVDPTYAPVNGPLVVAEPGADPVDPDRWQPLELETMVAQNGLPLDETVQAFVGPHWGHVTSFALPPADADGLTIDPGPPPRLDDPATAAELRRQVGEVIAHGALLATGDPDGLDGAGDPDTAVPATIDLSPGSLGATADGSYEPTGHPVNPATGEPYAPNVVAMGDYGRVVAEFWADGPRSETPPGHWNALANTVGDRLEELGGLRIDPELGGTGDPVDRLEWDVTLYLALNGAAHDAAVAAWGVKGHHDSSRPITLIRHLGGLGQSSDPAGPGHHPDGLLLEPGLVEVVTEASSAPGERHEHLADHVGEVAVRGWRGVAAIGDADSETDGASGSDTGGASGTGTGTGAGRGGVGWIRAVEWVPYQLPTFVTPSFAGYVSGHSTFSRAAAVVLTAITGDPFFPDGLGTWTIPADSLEFEPGPTADVELQWATYVDAATEAGRSRLYGGIHIRADDLRGRWLGQEVGERAVAEARTHIAPSG